MATSTFGFPLTYPRFKGFTSPGALASGYKVETYIAGTSTPLATYPTYADALAGTNANANPVVLNSEGEATIFGQGGQAYKLVYTDPAGSVIWTVDAIVLTDVPKSQTTVLKNGNQTLGAGSTKVTTWSVDTDALNEWSAVNNRWTATYAGKYVVILEVTMNDATTASVIMQAQIFKNGGQVANAQQRSTAINNAYTATVAYTWIAAAGDTIEAYAQGAAAATTAVVGGLGTRLTIFGIA